MRNNSQIYNFEGDDEHRHSVNALSENNENPLQEMKRILLLLSLLLLLLLLLSLLIPLLLKI